MARRHAGQSGLPPYGWVEMTPTTPERTCWLCGRPNVRVRHTVVCPGCDVLPKWPHGREARAA